MKITALEEYGLRCILNVAKAYPASVAANQVATDEALSVAYTQKILRLFAKSGLVDVQRGAKGGFTLVSPPASVSIGDVICALGAEIDVGNVCNTHTGDSDVCANADNCCIRPVWSHVANIVMHTLDAVSLETLMSSEENVAKQLRTTFPLPASIQDFERSEPACPIETLAPAT